MLLEEFTSNLVHDDLLVFILGTVFDKVFNTTDLKVKVSNHI